MTGGCTVIWQWIASQLLSRRCLPAPCESRSTIGCCGVVGAPAGVEACAKTVTKWLPSGDGASSGMYIASLPAHYSAASLPNVELCELRLWRDARSPLDVVSNMFKSLPRSEGTRSESEDVSTLCGSWRLNDVTGVLAADSSRYRVPAVMWVRASTVAPHQRCPA